MKSPEYFSKEELKDAVELCLENAEQYIKDADLLIESSSFGHAYAFGVLAYEEMGKAAVCIVWVLLYRHVNKDVLDKKKWRNKRENPLMNHTKKQKIMKGIDTLMEALPLLFSVEELEISEEDKKEITKYFSDSPDSIIEFNQLVFSYISDFKVDLEDLSEETDRTVKEFTLEDEKWRGLYVDYKDGKFISPKTVGKDDAIEFLVDVKKAFGRIKTFSFMILALSNSNALTEDITALVELS
ncbi:MAG TPA: AbiV family abortive infection protein [Desulfobacteria bacterium]|nr:AbiV family abortive infection protein [Desulfobacteria bacterium]